MTERVSSLQLPRENDGPTIRVDPAHAVLLHEVLRDIEGDAVIRHEDVVRVDRYRPGRLSMTCALCEQTQQQTNRAFYVVEYLAGSVPKRRGKKVRYCGRCVDDVVSGLDTYINTHPDILLGDAL